MTPALSLSVECPTCDGTGTTFIDVATRTGEHATETIACPDCDGPDDVVERDPIEEEDREWGVECAWSPYEAGES